MKPRVCLLMAGQDDPKKCTAAKMVRFGLARRVRSVPRTALLLHPYAPEMLLPSDRFRTVCALDCSWKRAAERFERCGGGRRLPPLLAGNPVNYSRPGMLSTVEAVAAALYITGHPAEASLALGKFNWGHTFLELNGEMLEEYAKAPTQGDMLDISSSYGLAPPAP